MVEVDLDMPPYPSMMAHCGGGYNACYGPSSKFLVDIFTHIVNSNSTLFKRVIGGVTGAYNST